MRIIDAFWEKRNLGVNCTEIEVDISDDPQQALSAILNAENDYTVVKISSAMTDMVLNLQENGFKYIESSFELSKRLNEKPELPGIFTRYQKDMTVSKANEEEIEMILSDIRTGNIFSTDRIAVDPAFSKRIAGERYANWICDLLKKDECCISIAKYKGNNVAFGVLDSKNGKANAVLGGLLSQYSKSAMGFLAVYANTLFSYECGNKSVYTHVSSNNMSILKLHMLFNYSINDCEYVFVKHKGNGE